MLWFAVTTNAMCCVCSCEQIMNEIRNSKFDRVFVNSVFGGGRSDHDHIVKILTNSSAQNEHLKICEQIVKFVKFLTNSRVRA